MFGFCYAYSVTLCTTLFPNKARNSSESIMSLILSSFRLHKWPWKHDQKYISADCKSAPIRFELVIYFSLETNKLDILIALVKDRQLLQDHLSLDNLKYEVNFCVVLSSGALGTFSDQYVPFKNHQNFSVD